MDTNEPAQYAMKTSHFNITVMRHGKPDLNLDSLMDQKVSGLEVGELVADYKQSSLSKQSRPTDSALNIANQASVIVSSDLPRALDSVDHLQSGQQHIVMEEMRECDLPYFRTSKIKFSVKTWFVALRLMWLVGLSRHAESISASKKRAQLVTDRLIKEAQQQPVLLLGHGIMNRIIDKQLQKQGWKQVRESNKDSYWGYITYEYQVSR